MQLEGKVAFVTGGGSGIGRATARRLAEEGALVGAFDRYEDRLQSLVEEVANFGGRAIALPGDVVSFAEVDGAVRKLSDLGGGLDFVFANAGVNGQFAPIEDLTVEEWRETIDINLTGSFLTLKAAIPRLKARGAGAIVITSSVNGTRDFSSVGASAYGAAKGAQLAFGQMAALELAPHGIRVNIICPGAITTRIGESTRKRGLSEVKPSVMYPEGRVPLTGGSPGHPEDVAELVLFLASGRSSLITGTPVWIDGAESLLVG